MVLKSNVEDCATASMLLALAHDAVTGSPFKEPAVPRRRVSATPSPIDDILDEDSSVESTASPSIEDSHNLLIDVLRHTVANTSMLSEDFIDDLTSEYASRKRRRIVSLSSENDLHENEISEARSAEVVTSALNKMASNMNRPQINWKTGTYSDSDGHQKKLSGAELEKFRRERNRMHAKMTRDRKKLFVASIEQAIVKLEYNNNMMREALSKHAEVAAYSAKQERLACENQTQAYPPNVASDEEDDDEDDDVDDEVLDFNDVVCNRLHAITHCG